MTLFYVMGGVAAWCAVLLALALAAVAGPALRACRETAEAQAACQLATGPDEAYDSIPSKDEKPPAQASPPGPGTQPRLLMTSRFYSDGVVFVDDHTKRRTWRFNPPPGETPGLTDDDIRRLLDGSAS